MCSPMAMSDPVAVGVPPTHLRAAGETRKAQRAHTWEDSFISFSSGFPASPPSWNLLPFLQRVSHAATQEWAVSARPGPAQLASRSHFPPHTG